jgi:hypothetical protein
MPGTRPPDMSLAKRVLPRPQVHMSQVRTVRPIVHQPKKERSLSKYVGPSTHNRQSNFMTQPIEGQVYHGLIYDPANTRRVNFYDPAHMRNSTSD